MSVSNGFDDFSLFHDKNIIGHVKCLVRYEDGEIVPGLAERWEVSSDGLTYTFYLKQGIKFSDGTDFNAEAVKINLDNIPGILAEFNGGWGLTSTLLDEVTVVDEYTVAVKLTTPYYGALQDFAVPMPMSMMSPAGYNEDGSLAEITKTKTLGTGPYMYDGQKENEIYTFVRNPYYDRGESDVDVFHVKVIGRPDICDIAAPYRIWTIRSKLFIQDILKFVAEIGIYGSDRPRFHPLGPDPHFLHIFPNSTF